MSEATVSDQDQFEYWLSDMPEGLARLKRMVPPALAAQLDLGSDSLPLLEQWLLASYASTAEMQAPDQAQRLDAAARYVGEVLRKRQGGRWAIELKDRKDAFWGLPQLRGMAGQQAAVCPLTLVTASAHRRTGTYLQTILAQLVANSEAAA